MPKSRVTYPASGTGPYVIPFGYLEQTHIVAYVDGVVDPDASVDSVTNTVTTLLVPSTDVEIRRSTPTTPLVDWINRSTIKESNLDIATLQGLYVSEELEDAQTAAAEASIADGSVTTIKIADGAVTEAKLHPDVVAQLGAGGVSDHGALTGLVDDDHTQYHNDTRGDARYNTKAEITSALSTKSNVGHSHSQADVVGLETELGLKLEAADIAGKSDVGHTHDDRYFTESEITSSLAGKANTGHLHVTSDVTGLDSALAGKASTSHTHTAANVTDFDTEVANNSAVVANTAKVSFPEAPNDGEEYVRKSLGWAVATGGGGGIADAPSDGTEYVRQDAAWVPNSGGAPVELGARPVYNAITDGGIVANYTNRLNPGTDQRAAVVAWIQNGLLAGKRHFHFPAGHYLFSEGIGNDSTVVDIQGYNDVIISGVPGETFFHTAQGLDLKYKNNPLFRIGWQQPTKRTIVRGITCVNDPYVTSSEESASDNGIQWGWKYYEPHRTSQAYEVGDIVVSSDDSWLITVTGAGTSASTEPTWSAGTTADGTCTVSVVALNNWTASTAYTAGAHVKSTNPNNYHTAIGATTRSILWASNSGTSGGGATEANVALPSNDGGSGANSENSWDWVAAANFASDTQILDCEFSGMAGFSEAGGTALGMSGGGGGLVQNCYFHNAAYGGVTSGLFRNWTFRDCKHYKLGGWGYCWGTFNAHGYYVQGARNLWDNCTFDRHFYGLNIKVHANPANNDVWQNRIINCRFDNYGWGSVEWVGPIAATNDEVATDFIEEATSGSIHSAILSKQGEVINCTFRIYKSVYDDWDWRRPGATPNSGSGFAIKASTDGILVVGCDFTDTIGIYAGTTANWLGGYSPITVSACSFQTIFRKTLPFDGTIFVDNCVFDYRAVLGWSTGVQLRDWSRMSNCTIMGTTTATGSTSDGALKIYGDFITVDNVTVSLTGVGQPFSPDSGNVHDNVRIANCKFIAPLGTLHLNPGSGKYWEFENNYWDISGWTSFRVTHNNHETWTWKNESGNLWTCRWDATQKVHNQGTVRIIPLPARSFNSQGGIVDESGIRVTDISNAYGVELINTDHAGGSPSLYKKFVAVSEDANQWILCSELVAKGDWLTLSASAGQLMPNGTSGSTTRPPSGIQARVINAGTASAGAGRALVEVLEWNRVSAAGGGLDATDIDTLAELNAIITDATLIDTADSRLSDARTPTAHTHTLADVTDSGTAAPLNVAAAGDAAAGEVVKGNDTRLTNARTPTAHTHTASEVTDFDTEVANNSAVTANTAKVTNATHTGDVTGSGALTIAADAVTNAKMANMAQSTIKGRAASAGTGDPTDLTATQVRTLINVANGATANSADATLLARANHTGTQTASTISDFATTVAGTAALKANNLSDLASAATARTNLGVSNLEEIVVACSDESTDLTTGTAKVTFRMPFAMTLTSVKADVNTAPTGSTLIADINEGGVSILSTKLSIDASEKTSATAASAAVISDSSLAANAEMTIDIDQIGSTVAGKGLKVTLIGTRT